MLNSPGISAASGRLDVALAQVLEDLDGRKAMFRIEAVGSRWEPLQAMRPGGPPLRPSDFRVEALHDLAGDRMRLSWRRDFIEPLTDTVHYDEILVGTGGYITGADVALHPHAARAMTSDRLAAVRRQQYLLHPQLLVGDALRRQSASMDAGTPVIAWAGRQDVDGDTHDVIVIESFPRPVRLFVSVVTGRLSHLVTEESDHPNGDVQIRVTFSDWRVHDGLAIPYDATLCWDGTVLHRESRERVELHPDTGDAAFALPETVPFDHDLAERGAIHAQWIHRCLAMGAPISLDAGDVVVEAITPDVVTFGGGIHHSLAVALDEGVVVIDPPQHEERSLAVIESIRARWPDKPITHLVLTHHHFDHSGGIRAYAALGAMLIVARGDREFVAQCLARPHTIVPDSLAATDARPELIAVGDAPLILGDGAVEIHRISSPHCAEDLLVYAAGPKLLFNADLFNPGLVPAGAAPPPHWLEYSRDFRRCVEALGLEIDVLLGAHGALDGRPYQSLIDFTEATWGI